MNSELPLTVDTGRGFSINYKGQSLYSRYNPSKTPERIALNHELDEDTLYLLPSPLLMYGVDILLTRLPESSFLLGIECDQELMKLSMSSGSLKSHSRFELVRLDTREQLKTMIDRLGSWRFRRSKAIFLNSGYNLNKDIYDTLINFAALHLNTFWKNRLTLNKLGALWIRNIFQNLELVQSDLPDNSGKKIVVCGAGPSLDSTINMIREHRNHLYIIAVDTALSTLLDAHIEPDLVFALEAQFYNLGDFHNTGSSSFELLADLTSYPAVCRLNNGRVYFTFTDFAETVLINRLKEFGLSLIEIPPLGSVGVAAVYSALAIFSEPIFLTGLDFSYIPGKSHSKGSPFIKSILRSNDRLHPLTNNSGIRRRNIIKLQGKIPETEITTDSILSGYGRLLSELLRDSNRVFDLSREGFPLNIPFVDEKELSEIISSQENTGADIPCKTIHTFDSRGFLENELNLLSFVISLWDKFIQSNNSEIPQELMNALVQVDYIYIDFPDKLPHPVNDLSFVSRAVKKAREYSGLIERILKNK